MWSKANHWDLEHSARKGFHRQPDKEMGGQASIPPHPTEIRASFYNPKGWGCIHIDEKGGKTHDHSWENMEHMHPARMQHIPHSVWGRDNFKWGKIQPLTSGGQGEVLWALEQIWTGWGFGLLISGRNAGRSLLIVWNRISDLHLCQSGHCGDSLVHLWVRSEKKQ